MPDPLPRLDRSLLQRLDPEAADGLPRPVRAVQFGTGALLRGLVDDALDLAARAGRWNGSVVVVSQTGSGRGVAFDEQDGLYTLVVRGLDGGEPVERTRVVTAVARALSAQDEWGAVLDLARDENVGLVISNTTEVGLTWDDGDDPAADPPRSFPAKLAAWLKARRAGLSAEAGVVVLPTELVEGNGDRLRDLVLRWGERAGWGDGFADFVREQCVFANTLVDRIVPGEPEDADELRERLGYRDGLLTEAEVYRLWAIESLPRTQPAPDSIRGSGGDAALRDRLPFADGDPAEGAGVVVTESVAPFRLRKVRILNGAHTLMVPLALGCGLTTVREAVEDAAVGAFVRRLVFDEVVPTVAAEPGVEPGSAERFAEAVLERFANPFLRHELVSITLQQTMKLGVRAAPTVEQYAAMHGAPPEAAALGFAAYLLMQRAVAGLDGSFGAGFTPLRDDRAGPVRAAWQSVDVEDEAAVRALVRDVLGDAELWGTDLAAVPGFAERVGDSLDVMLVEGLPAALDAFLESQPAR